MFDPDSLPLEPESCPPPQSLDKDEKSAPQEEFMQLLAMIGDRRFAISIMEDEITRALHRLHELKEEFKPEVANKNG